MTADTMATTPTSRERLPSIACQPWCCDTKGHAGEFHVEDQYCFSEFREQAVSTRALVEMGSGEYEVDRLDLLLRRRPGEQTVLVVNDETNSVELCLTIAEMRQMASTMLDLAAVAESAGLSEGKS